MRFPTAHGIQRTGPCRVSGSHLSLAPNSPEFSEAQLLAADRQRNENKSERWHATNDAQAMELQLHQMRVEGWL